MLSSAPIMCWKTKTARGAYVAAGDATNGKITLVASGSEVAVALAAREMLVEMVLQQQLSRCHA